jgi:iron(III) transport system permease protein
MRGAIVVHAAAAVPWVMLIVGLGLRLVERELEEQALLDAAPARVCWHVTLVRARPAIALAALWVAVTTAGEMTVTDLFQVRTFAEELYTDFSLGDEPSVAAWATLPSVAATALLVLGTLAIAARLLPFYRQPLVSRPLVFELGPWRWPLALVVHGAVAALAGLPLASLAYKAGLSVTRVGEAWQRDWSPLKAARAALWDAPWRFASEIGWSLLVAALASAGAVALAIVLAWSARRGGWRALPAALVTALALALPGPLVGLAIVSLSSSVIWPPLVWLADHTILPLWLAQEVKALPAAVLVMWHAFATVPDAWIETAQLEGAGVGQIVRRVALPARRGAVLLALAAGFVVALGELSASVLTEPPGITTLAIRIAQLVHYGVDDQLAGVCLLLAVGCLVVVGVAMRPLTPTHSPRGGEGEE